MDPPIRWSKAHDPPLSGELSPATLKRRQCMLQRLKARASSLPQPKNLPPPSQPQNSTLWPKGTRQKLKISTAEYFLSLLSNSTVSLYQILQAHPELPPYQDLLAWKRKHPWFATAWKVAREAQAEFLMQRCLDLADKAEPANAHSTRIKFDIYKHMAAKLHPTVYGDKSQQASPTVNIGIAISPERLTELRTKLEATRTSLKHSARLTPAHALPAPSNQDTAIRLANPINQDTATRLPANGLSPHANAKE